MINVDNIDKTVVEVCLNCQLYDCNENSEECQLYHPKKGVIMEELTVEQKKAIAIEAKERGVKLVAEEQGIEWTTVRAWIGSYCRKPKGEKIPELKTPEVFKGLDDLISKDNGLLPLFEKTLEEEDICLARAFWAGVKAGRGME